MRVMAAASAAVVGRLAPVSRSKMSVGQPSVVSSGLSPVTSVRLARAPSVSRAGAWATRRRATSAGMRTVRPSA